MSNRIRGPEGSPIEGSNTRGVERVRAAGAVKSAPRADQQLADTVHITDSARAVLALQEAVAAVPDIDAARVAHLQQNIEQHSYNVDAGKIADRLMSLEGDLLAAGQTRKY